jgi:hypothetical protein
LPYASELFGVYKSFLGWKGLKTSERVLNERNLAIQLLIRSMLEYLKTAIFVQPGPVPRPVFDNMKLGLQTGEFESAWQNVVLHVERAAIKFYDNEKRFPWLEIDWGTVFSMAKDDLNSGN